MFEELMSMLAHPEQYECIWHDGEFYVRPVVTEAAPPQRDKAVRELEPA